MWIQALDQCNLLGPFPALQLFLASDRFMYIIKRSPVKQAVYGVAIGESWWEMEFVLEDALVQIARHAGVKSAGEAAHDVDTVGAVLGHIFSPNRDASTRPRREIAARACSA
jgi:hypothetical protein